MCNQARMSHEPEPLFDAAAHLFDERPRHNRFAVDLRRSANNYPPRRSDADPTLWSAAIDAMRASYVGEHDISDWRVSPQAAADLSRLPPAIVVILQVDPLRDEAIIDIERLRVAGVSAEVIEFDNRTHGFAHVPEIVPAAAKALDDVVGRFETALAARACIDRYKRAGRQRLASVTMFRTG